MHRRKHVSTPVQETRAPDRFGCKLCYGPRPVFVILSQSAGRVWLREVAIGDKNLPLPARHPLSPSPGFSSSVKFWLLLGLDTCYSIVLSLPTLACFTFLHICNLLWHGVRPPFPAMTKSWAICNFHDILL